MKENPENQHDLYFQLSESLHRILLEWKLVSIVSNVKTKTV